MNDAIENGTADRREGTGRKLWLRSVALVGSGLVAGGILAGTLSANAATTDTSGSAATSSTSQSSTSQSSTSQEAPAPAGTGDPSQPQRSDEQLLTGDTATKVTDAAMAKYPGATIQRVETDSDGVYEAHVVTDDGQHVIVQVGSDFTVTGTQSH